jgi:hypothetical protein
MRKIESGNKPVVHGALTPKPQPGGKCADLSLTPLELIDKIAALVPPPRKHRLRYFGALAPNSPLREVVTAMATRHSGATSKAPVAGAVAAIGSSARTAWATLIARIYEVFPLLCLHCGGQLRIIAFITAGGEVKKILDHLGMDSRPPRITPARGPPLWDQQDVAETFDAEAQTDLVPESPEFQCDQRIDW